MKQKFRLPPPVSPDWRLCQHNAPIWRNTLYFRHSGRSPFAQSPDSRTCSSRNARMLCDSCLNAQVSSHPHSRFHSWAWCSATHCQDDQRQKGGVRLLSRIIGVLDPHILSVHGSAICVALVCYIRDFFWCARSDNRRKRDKTSVELSSVTDLRSSELSSSMTVLLGVAVPCMKATILRAAFEACSGEGAYDVDPLTASIPRPQLGVTSSYQNDTFLRHAGFA